MVKSVARSRVAKKNLKKNTKFLAWTRAVKEARKEEKITGFVLIKKNTKYYKTAKRIYREILSGKRTKMGKKK